MTGANSPVLWRRLRLVRSDRRLSSWAGKKRLRGDGKIYEMEWDTAGKGEQV